MKQSMTGYLYSLVFLLVGSLITSSILAALYYYHVLSTSVYEGIAVAAGLVLFLIAGLMLGKKTTKKALLHAFVFVIPFTLVAVLSHEFVWSHLLMSLIKGLAYTFGTILGVNRK